MFQVKEIGHLRCLGYLFCWNEQVFNIQENSMSGQYLTFILKLLVHGLF